ncbi:phosphotransacetylase family protein [Spirulina major CS-329]|uniref:phosphotransacetylase family protein n=1 Tax=Spirulina TaxID=1154 RepID=UPI00232E7A6B|nr:MULTISPECIES: phosphotransacetylase family protein [Spirulina]MDB9494893.1 phosphotransacetylase family protein [Spirulina subsalsa CS-330]MDB9504120.1 phosphotransacetylase family protein [Spirulina major CS-329]
MAQAKHNKHLLIGSTIAHSGKSAVILGLAHQLNQQGIQIGYGKPLGTYLKTEAIAPTDADVQFITEQLALSPAQTKAPLLTLNEASFTQYLQPTSEVTNVMHSLSSYVDDIAGDLVLLEGPGSLSEGRLLNLSLVQMAAQLDLPVLMTALYHPVTLIDELLDVQEALGDHLMGVVINDIPESDAAVVAEQVAPYLERQGIPVFAQLPRNGLLRSVSVRELATKLEAKVLCRPDRLDLMVESLTIGAMNVNSALEYFRKGRNMAVVTGGDRSELQLAALETSTNCLILTGHSAPQDFILSRAEDLEIPILSVDLDTLTTVEIADQSFGQVRLQEPIKVQCIQELMHAHFDTPRLMQALGLEPSPVNV